MFEQTLAPALAFSLHDLGRTRPARAYIAHLNRVARGWDRDAVSALWELVPPEQEARWSDDEVREALLQHLAVGMSRGAAARAIAQWSGWPRREVYQLDLSNE